MNCPNCGAYNHAQNFRCIRCGQVLPPSDDVDSAAGYAEPQDPAAADEERRSTPSWEEEQRWQEQSSGSQQDPWQQQAQSPRGPGQPPPSQQQWSSPPPAPPPYAGPPRDVQNYLWQSIAVTLCCCWPAGIPAIYFATQVNSRLAAGDIAAAEDASNKARMWTLIALGGGVFAYIILGICVVLGYIPAFVEGV